MADYGQCGASRVVGGIQAPPEWLTMTMVRLNRGGLTATKPIVYMCYFGSISKPPGRGVSDRIILFGPGLSTPPLGGRGAPRRVVSPYMPRVYGLK